MRGAGLILEEEGKDRLDSMAYCGMVWKMGVQKADSLSLGMKQVHVQRVFHTYSKPNIVTEAKKLMHRFTAEEVEALIDEAEGHS